MKRKGETFAEFLTAATVFGIIAASMFEFMANQTQTLANIRDRDNLIYGAQVVCNWTINEDVSGIPVRNHSVLHNIDHSVIAGQNGTYHYSQIPTIDSPIPEMQKIVSFDWDKQHNILTVKNNNASMIFTLKP